MIKLLCSFLLIISNVFAQNITVCNPSYGFKNVSIDYNPVNVRIENGLLNMYLTRDTGGSGITYGSAIHYGEINVVMKVSEGNNVVTAFYIKAENGDEVDFEMVRNRTDLNRVMQTVFYYRGIPLYEVNAQYFIANNTLSQNYNKYTIVWKPDYYEWKFNDMLLRRTTRNDTDTYPDSLSNIKISVWEAKPSRWAGPGINWNQQPFVLSIKSIEVVCDNSRNLIQNQTYSKFNTLINSCNIVKPLYFIYLGYILIIISNI